MTTSRSSASASFSRPAFWKVPGYELPTSYRPQATRKPPLVPLPSPCRRRSSSGLKKRVHFADEQNVGVQVGSPAHGELLRGDIISKIGEYDARDLSHADAQQLFRGAGNEIRLVVHRDNKIAYTQGATQEAGPGSRSNSTLPPVTPDLLPHRGPSPFLPGPSHFERALQLPVDTLPQTVFPQLNSSGGYEVPSTVFSPKPTRDHQQDVDEEQAAIVNQVFHKQFNSPIGLYSNNNIEDTIRSTVPFATSESNRLKDSPLHRPLPTKLNGYKKTVQYDPRNSETYRAIQEEGGYSNYGQSSPQEVTIPVQTKVYQPNRLVPGKKPVSAPVSRPPYNVVNTHDENIRQSGSFNRLMYSVIGATEY
ncbi:PDZ and LIM domain protein 3 isoform X6 [Drosophila simulans]|uniref:PDZ and LIM domain protein 3 isoform X6 n=1 Tax=Drosophila simulans TaxID=7240 RepID=UPI00192CFE9F|nr:PDZ and LIM domain protein 3 isoform X6 [Drosophila simulans]